MNITDKEIVFFGMLDEEIAKYLGIPLRTYIEKTENLSDDDLNGLEGLLIEWFNDSSHKFKKWSSKKEK